MPSWAMQQVVQHGLTLGRLGDHDTGCLQEHVRAMSCCAFECHAVPSMSVRMVACIRCNRSPTLDPPPSRRWTAGQAQTTPPRWTPCGGPRGFPTSSQLLPTRPVPAQAPRCCASLAHMGSASCAAPAPCGPGIGICRCPPVRASRSPGACSWRDRPCARSSRARCGAAAAELLFRRVNPGRVDFLVWTKTGISLLAWPRPRLKGARPRAAGQDAGHQRVGEQCGAAVPQRQVAERADILGAERAAARAPFRQVWGAAGC